MTPWAVAVSASPSHVSLHLCAWAQVYDRYDGDVLEVVQERGAFSEAHAVVVMRHLVTGLAGLHAQGVVHGDVCLWNLFHRTTDTGDVEYTLGDLGVARAVADDDGELSWACAEDVAAAGNVAAALLTAASCDAACDDAVDDLLKDRRCSECARAFVRRLRSAMAAPVRAVDLLADPFLAV